MKKINVITLGCSKNTVDSEHLMARLAAAGYEVLFDSDRTDAKVVVINTCGFIGDAKQAVSYTHLDVYKRQEYTFMYDYMGVRKVLGQQLIRKDDGIP